jgi:hypothetical protein
MSQPAMMSLVFLLLMHVLIVALSPSKDDKLKSSKNGIVSRDTSIMTALFDDSGFLKQKRFPDKSSALYPSSSKSAGLMRDRFFLTSIYRYKEGSPALRHYPVLPMPLQTAQDLRPLLNTDMRTFEESGQILDRYGQSLPFFTLSKHPKNDLIFTLNQSEIFIKKFPPLLPDPSDRQTILNLAKMCYNDYYRPNDTENHYLVDPFFEVSTVPCECCLASTLCYQFLRNSIYWHLTFLNCLFSCLTLAGIMTAYEVIYIATWIRP